MTTQEEWIATLVHPDEYVRNANQVAIVTTHKLAYIKRKELALKPFERIDYPIEQCKSITYKTKLALFPMFLGFISICIVLLISWGVFTFYSELPAATKVPIGAVGLVAIYGVTRLLGAKRHSLTFEVAGKNLHWQSRAGEFKSAEVSIGKVSVFARERGLWRVAQS